MHAVHSWISLECATGGRGLLAGGAGGGGGEGVQVVRTKWQLLQGMRPQCLCVPTRGAAGD